LNECFVFDSRSESCKTPYGAVPCGTEVTLHTYPLEREGFTHCALVYRMEFAEVSREVELRRETPRDGRAVFSLTLRPFSDAELVWYHFRFWREDGSGCALDRTGYRSDDGRENWQLTVYEPVGNAPAWFADGITYQIFPDRFCRLSVPDPAGMVGNRTVHACWEDTPKWRPDPDGVVRCDDFFGGSLRGILSKLDELAAMGVTTLYLCPIFESASNHRYNTGDYRKIDPMLGTEEDFRLLCEEAHARGMRVLLDGVFNHTGSDSLYFNAEGHYPSLGAAQNTESPYYSWYHFTCWPENYDAWWGIRTLPAVNEEDAGYRNFIVDGEDAVIRRWLRLGADGWRLDVADELPDDFIARIRCAMDETKPDTLLLGEVWEDGSNKIAYSRRRRYLLGRETHGLMNYPFRSAALAYLQGGDAAAFYDVMEELREHYPAPAFYSAMNFLGTHDTPRILTVLGARRTPESKDERAAYQLNAEEYERGVSLLKLAALLLYAFPGSPTVYYGDEAGMQGFEDPFNRGAYPWGREDGSLKNWYLRLGQLRRERVSLRRGALHWLFAAGAGLAFSRSTENERTVCVLNAGSVPLRLSLPWSGATARCLLSGAQFHAEDGLLPLYLPPVSELLLAD
jgi:cyclomaltodextrinase